MNGTKMSTALSTAEEWRVTPCLFLLGKRTKRALQTASQVVRNLQQVTHALRIIIFLHSARIFSSVLSLYCIEHPSEKE